MSSGTMLSGAELLQEQRGPLGWSILTKDSKTIRMRQQNNDDTALGRLATKDYNGVLFLKLAK